MSDWLEQSKGDTWRWDRLDWPNGLSEGASGEYRIYEHPEYGRQSFAPQWRSCSSAKWQNWYRTTWGRCGSAEVVSFETLHEARAWLDEACRNKPKVVAHQYAEKEAA